MTTQPGILAAAGTATAEDLTAFTAARLRAVRLRAQVNPAADVPRWRDAGAQTILLQLLSPLPGQQATSPQDFVAAFAAEIADYVAQGVYHLEIHDEPNRADRGCGISWADGAAFGVWFSEVAALLRAQFGPLLRIGFPALAPPGPPRLEPPALIDEATFLDGCAEALDAADWAALHTYWTSAQEMCAYDGALRFLRRYLERFEAQQFWITEFANVAAADAAARGAQYAEFYTLLAQYDRIAGGCSFLLRATDPQYEPLGWLTGDGVPRQIVTQVARRPNMPSPLKLRLQWPTELRFYNQYFGENQTLYQQCCQMTGGHNGVDLRVRRDPPETSPIVAALSGSVTQVAYDQTGYGYHLRVTSYGPQDEEITLLYAHLSRIDVSMGTLVTAGDVLGMAGSTGFSTGPHLHLGMRIANVSLPALNHWLNPRPYLDPPAVPGLPREPYARTYVLLPPTADATWAVAAVQGSWERQRFTIGGSADDAGIGDLDFRRIVAVNPAAWGADLAEFFATHYPGTLYVPLNVTTPAALTEALEALPSLPETPPAQPPAPRGLPREPYERTYLLLSPSADATWAAAAVAATWNDKRLTVGGSADDAGIGALEVRRIIA
ncbi:MAG TPA: M23 family metallopeptidase, partial [Chloroflexi bacterium]|nr:M23 family metallopeptidase [Chloroflexota bacterium]